MSKHDLISSKKVGFIGCGNMGQAILNSFLNSGLVKPANVGVITKTAKKQNKLSEELGIKPFSTIEELIDFSDLVIIAIKPQDIYSVIEPISSSFHEDHMVWSLAAGVSLYSLQGLIGGTRQIVRVMPNTASKIGESVVAYSATEAAKVHSGWVEELLKTLGYVVSVQEGDEMEALTVAAGSGIGFVLELMTYWQEWLEERGVERREAKNITAQVFFGTAALVKSSPNISLEELQRKVVSTKGVTHAGLTSMSELEIERALRYSFEKAALRDKELGQNWQKTNEKS